jgi:RNA polymerase sigma factor (sigma-70 family)
MPTSPDKSQIPPQTTMPTHVSKRTAPTTMPSHQQNLELFKLMETAKFHLAELQTNPGTPPAELRQWEDEFHRVKNQLILANQGLVGSIAKKYENRGLDLRDLVQEGLIGLGRAVLKFDANLGNRFTTFATPSIKGAIIRAISKQARTIRIPEDVLAKLGRLKKTMERLSKEYGCEPLHEDIADETGFSVSKVRALIALDQQTISLDAPLGEAGGTVLVDVYEDVTAVDPADEAERANRAEMIKEMMVALTDRERDVIGRRYGLKDGRPCTLEEVAADLGVSRERIRQIQHEAMAKMFSFHETRKIRSQVKAEMHGSKTKPLAAVKSPAPVIAATASRLVKRAVEKNENHHLWNNNGVWYTDFMVKNDAGKSKRVRNSLWTDDDAIARRRRDVLIGLYQHFSGN